MNKQTEQSELNRIIAQQTLQDENVIEAFIGHLFTEIEKSIIVDSHIKVDGLGLFRVIKSGDFHRILYLGSNAPIDKSIDLSHIDIESVDRNANNVENVEAVSADTYLSSQYEDPTENDKREETSGNTDLTQEGTDEADAIVIRNFLDSEKNKEISQADDISIPLVNRPKLDLVKTFIISLIVLVLLGIGYMVLLGTSVKPKEKTSKDTVITFKELDNADTINYSRIIIPESDVSLQYIAKTYYGNDIYWPYVFEANKNIVNNQFIIQAGSITKIPKIAVDLVGLNNGNEASIAQALADEINKEIR